MRKKGKKKKYTYQYARTAKNKVKAWDRHLKNHPNDKEARVHIPVAKSKLRTG